MIKNIKLPILQEDWQLAREVGEKRLKFGKASKGWGNRTIEQESIGVIGEILVCKYFNKKTEFVFGKSDFCDLMIGNKRVDVKTSLMKPYWNIDKLHLLAHTVSVPKDIYIRVLVECDKKNALITGWIERENLEKFAILWEYNKHMLYKLPMEYLKDIELLKEEKNDN